MKFFATMILAAGCTAAAYGQRPASSGDTLRVMTYNIHHCNPPTKIKSGEIDLDAVAKVINDQRPDVVALQEVDVRTKRANGVDQAKALAEKTGMNVYFAKAIDHDGGDYGVAILSRFRMSNARTVRLPEESNPAAEDRVVALAEIRFRNGHKLTIASTHLDVSTAANRDEQATAIVGIAAKLKRPMIIGGDFNAKPDSRTYEILAEAFVPSCTDCGFTIPVDKPNRVIDFVFASKGSRLEPVASAVVNEPYPSDHLPVITDWIIR
ncbi:endonuclease/exonuclease/phosphatase family protein [Chitinophaga lutea]